MLMTHAEIAEIIEDLTALPAGTLSRELAITCRLLTHWLDIGVAIDLETATETMLSAIYMYLK